MTSDDAWQAQVTREAAKEIGRWLEARGAGRLARPIASLTMADLEAMASVAICRFICLSAQRIKEQPNGNEDLIQLLLG